MRTSFSALCVICVALASTAFEASATTPETWTTNPDVTVEKLRIWLEQIDRAIESGDDERARALALAAAKARSGDVDLLFSAARLEGAAGRTDSALTLLRRAIAIAPKYVDLRLYAGRVLGWAGRTDEAIAHVDAVLVQHPQSLEALLLRGDLSMWAGEPGNAAPFYARGHDLEPSDSVFERRLIGALSESGDGDALRAFFDTLPRREDDRQRAQERARWEAEDADARFDASIARTFTNPGDWQTLSAGASFRVADPLWVGLRTDWEHRGFGATVTLADTTLTLPVVVEPAPAWFVATEVSWTPSASFAPQGRLSLEVGHDVSGLFGAVMGYRFSRYAEVDAHTFFPSLVFHIWPISIEPTVLVTTTPGSVDVTGRLKLIGHLPDHGRVEAWGFVGTEPIEATLSSSVNAPLQAGLLLSLTHQIRPLSSMRAIYAYSAPVRPFDPTAPAGARVRPRHTIALGWTHKLRMRRGGEL